MSRLMCFLLIPLLGTAALSGTKPLVELTIKNGEAYQGRVELLEDEVVTLMQRDGRIRKLTRKKIASFRKVSDRFRPYRKEEIARRLKDEISDQYRIRTTQHYVIVQPKGSKTNYGAIFENVFGAFHYQFRRRSIPLKRTEFPLIAIVFRNFREFAAYAKKDGLTATPGLLGYYHRHSNRVAVYESSRSASLPADKGLVAGPMTVDGNVLMRAGSTDLASTITHETMHQVGFNTGVHPRLGYVPKWIVEGLAMTFEAPGFLATSGLAGTATRINRDRFVWFRNFNKGRRGKGSLQAFIESDRVFQTNALDAYSEAWALTFFFLDQPARSYKYRQYLNKMNARDLTKGYSKAERVQDFKRAFGDMQKVEMNFLRYLEKLDPNSVASR